MRGLRQGAFWRRGGMQDMVVSARSPRARLGKRNTARFCERAAFEPQWNTTNGWKAVIYLPQSQLSATHLRGTDPSQGPRVAAKNEHRGNAEGVVNSRFEA